MEVENERDLLQQADRVASLSECFTWLQQCDECIKRIEERSRAKLPRLSIGNRQSLVARIARLEGAKIQLQRRFFIHFGDDYTGASSSSSDAERLVWREIDTAFENRIMTGAVINFKHIEPRQFLEDAREIVLERVRSVIQEQGNIKINTVFNGEFVADDKRANKSITTRNYELFRSSDLQEWYQSRIIEPTLTSLEEFQERDSGWALSRILNLTINVNKYNPLHAGCYIELPREIKLKRAVINVRSMDNACFAWSVMAALHPVERNPERESSYPHYSTVLNFKDIEFPMTPTQIKKFENQNNISINVYRIEKQKERSILPIRLTEKKMEKHVNLLYMQNDDDVGHFAWIKSLSRLVSSQLNKHKSKKYFCDRYVYIFNKKKIIKYFITLRENKNIYFFFADAYTTSVRVKSWRLTLLIVSK